jgi:hypothetical protein
VARYVGRIIPGGDPAALPTLGIHADRERLHRQRDQQHRDPEHSTAAEQ